MTVSEIQKKLEEQNYFSSPAINYSIFSAMTLGKPILIEGDPGAGKTSLAKAVAGMLKIPLIRLQMYDGLTDDKVLYDYDYQRQLLTLEAVKPKLEKALDGKDVNESIKEISNNIDFYGKDFLIPRPILRSIDGTGQKLLLIDEIDKASEETEYMLYEFLEDYSITIPQYGRIECPKDQRPLVFLTSNGYRELSGAMRRRCAYLYIEKKYQEEITKILKMRATVDDRIAYGIACCMVTLQEEKLKHPVSISEAIDWAKMIAKDPSKEAILNAIGLIAKDRRDIETIKDVVLRKGQDIWDRQEGSGLL